MTEPLRAPGPESALRRTPPPFVPPMPRSRTGVAFSVAAARGEFQLQHCGACGAVAYPFRDCCPRCLAADLHWRDATPSGKLIAMTTIRVSQDSYYSRHVPWRTGTVVLADGPSAIVHVHGDVAPGDPVRIIARTDKSGNGVIMALPEKDTENMMDDPQLRELTCSPKFRRILVTDGTTAIGGELAKALLKAEAAEVILGVPARPGAQVPEDLAANSKVRICLLEVTDRESVEQACASIGGTVDILVNNAMHVRPGGRISGRDPLTDRDEMEVNYFGLLNLVGAFAPVMASRAADEPRSACAWVNMQSVYAFGNHPGFDGTSASFAAARSALLSLRARMRQAGIKVTCACVGPTDDEWYADLPPPKVGPAVVARQVVHALEQGIEQVAIGTVAQDIVQRWRENPELLERELTRL